MIRKYLKEKIAYDKGYRVTLNGDVINPEKNKIGYIVNSGYENITIKYKDETINKIKHLKVATHRLQAYQKYGNEIYKTGIVVRHLNGNKYDNSFNNIGIGTQKDNALDIPKEKRIEMARKAGTKYNDDKVIEIKNYYSMVKSYIKTMKHFGLTSKGTLHYIIKNR
jgi:hypothetical protein